MSTEDFTVKWEIDVLNAEGPIAAAKQARFIQQDAAFRRANVGVFDVTDSKGHTFRVDLDQPDNEIEAEPIG